MPVEPEGRKLCAYSTQSQLMVTKKVETGLQDLVQPLCQTVGLEVASRRETDLGAEEVAEFLPETGCQLWTPV